MMIFCVENDTKHLLLVDDALYVVNGHYKLVKHRDGTFSTPHTNFKVQFLFDTPVGRKYEGYDEKTGTYPALNWAERKLRKENAA